MTLKVMHIGKYFPPFAGGMETYLRDLMTAQVRLGIAVTALVHRSAVSLRSSDERVELAGQRVPVTRAAVWARFVFTPISPGFAWLLNRLIKQQRPDILHLHVPNVSAFWVLLLPSARRLPWVIHWQSDVPVTARHRGIRLFYRLYRPFQSALLRRSKAIIVSSPPYLSSSEALLPYRHKCHVIPLGLDPANLGDVTGHRKRTRGGTLRVLAVGRLTYYKGLEYLIRATATLEKIETHIVGSGELAASLQKLAGELGAADKVSFHGYLSQQELAGQFSDCDCLCLPSVERTEAFGMVLLEAMYYGKPTIASNVPGSGMGWVVDDGVTGILVTPENTQSLAEALSRLQNDIETGDRMGAAGRQKFDRLFHIDRSATAISELYTLLLGASPARRSQAKP
jgi:rhamnosyl/mannosyltransferase